MFLRNPTCFSLFKREGVTILIVIIPLITFSIMVLSALLDSIICIFDDDIVEPDQILDLNDISDELDAEDTIVHDTISVLQQANLDVDKDDNRMSFDVLAEQIQKDSRNAWAKTTLDAYKR
jgi:hypothetical protein